MSEGEAYVERPLCGTSFGGLDMYSTETDEEISFKGLNTDIYAVGCVPSKSLGKSCSRRSVLFCLFSALNRTKMKSSGLR